MKKNHDIRVRLSSEERERIRNKASKFGMSISAFMRALALTANLIQQNGSED